MIIAFIGVVILEAWIINKIIKQDFKSVLRKTVFVNFLTTIVGYFLQGILRLIILSFTPHSDIIWKNPYVAGVLGNVGSTHSPMRLFEIVPIATMVEVLTSFLITFFLSVVIETWSLKRSYAENEEVQKVVPIATLKANIASYLVLFVWVLYYIKNH